MNKEFKGTKGNWQINERSLQVGVKNSSEKEHLNDGCICRFHVGTSEYQSHEETVHNAILIADAGNTIQSCGILPSELLKQNQEMRELIGENSFVQRMQSEMKANEQKGDWKEFAIKENRPEILREIEHHYNKLVLAFEANDDELIREHSADIGNIAMFMFESTNP